MPLKLAAFLKSNVRFKKFIGKTPPAHVVHWTPRVGIELLKITTQTK